MREVNAGQTGRTPLFASDAPPAIFLFQLPNPLLQELPLWFLLSQRQRLLIRSTSLSGPAEPAVHIGTGGMRQVIICQFAVFQHRVDIRQTGLWTIAHGNGHGTIELYNWRRLNSYQLVVEHNDLPPVGRGDGFRLGMNGRNRCLQRVRAERRDSCWCFKAFSSNATPSAICSQFQRARS